PPTGGASRRRPKTLNAADASNLPRGGRNSGHAAESRTGCRVVPSRDNEGGRLIVPAQELGPIVREDADLDRVSPAHRVDRDVIGRMSFADRAHPGQVVDADCLEDLHAVGIVDLKVEVGKWNREGLEAHKGTDLDGLPGAGDGRRGCPPNEVPGKGWPNA